MLLLMTMMLLITYIRDGVRWLHAAAEGGYVEARYQLGLVYLDGLGGVPVDKPSALIQFETAAALGHVKAALAVAQIYYDQVILPTYLPTYLITSQPIYYNSYLSTCISIYLST